MEPITLTTLILSALVSALLAWRATRKLRPVTLAVSPSSLVLLSIEVPKENEKDSLAAEQMFASLHGLLKLTPETQEHISFEITSSLRGVNFYVSCPENLRSFVEGQIYAQYPAADIRRVEDYATFEPTGKQMIGAQIFLARPDIFPIKTFREFEVDPLAAVTSALSKIEENEQIWLQLIIRPVPDVWQAAGHQYVEQVRLGLSAPSKGAGWLPAGVVSHIIQALKDAIKMFLAPTRYYEEKAAAAKATAASSPRLSAGQELELKAIENKLTRMGFESGMRVVAIASSLPRAKDHLRSLVASLKQFSTANLNSFVSGEPVLNPAEFLAGYAARAFSKNPYILNTEELASLFHLPNVSVETPTIAWAWAKKSEPPLNLPTEDCTYFAKTTFRSVEEKFGIERVDRRRHMYIIGKTGTGKSELLKNLVIADMHAGEGMAVLDPHGETIETLMEFVPRERIEDIVVFDPSDLEHPTSLNMLELVDPTQKNLMASGLVEVFKKHFGDISWGPRLEYLLNNCILTLLEVPNTTLLGITRLLNDDNYQNYIVNKVKDPVIRDFWQKEYRQMKGNQKLITEAISPIQNKVGRFLASSTIRNILGQARSTVRLDEIMNTRKILFVNLSKGRIGEDNAALLGSLIISRLQFMAMQRIKIKEEERHDFFLYADEFQNFASASFAVILSEARKYRLNLILAHQYIAQLPLPVRDAIFGNVGTLIAFAVGPTDALTLAKEFAPTFTENDLIFLDKFHIYLKLMIDGMSSQPFSAVTLPPSQDYVGAKDEIIERSRAKYAKNREEVEAKIAKWTQTQFDLGMAKAEEMRETKEKEDGQAGKILPVESVTEPISETKPQAPHGEILLGSATKGGERDE